MSNVFHERFSISYCEMDESERYGNGFKITGSEELYNSRRSPPTIEIREEMAADVGAGAGDAGGGVVVVISGAGDEGDGEACGAEVVSLAGDEGEWVGGVLGVGELDDVDFPSGGEGGGLGGTAAEEG